MSVNSDLFDRTLSRAVTLARLSSGETTELLRLFDKLERELIASLLQRDLTKYQQVRFAALLTQVRQTVRTHYRTIRDTHQEKMEDLADLESTWTVRALNGALSAPVGVYIDVASISWTAQQLKAIASEAMIEGSPARSWWGKQATDLTRRFKEEVKTGLLKGETTEQIVKRVREATTLSKQQARGLVRTSISAVSASARRMTFEENADLIKAIQHRSTLDSKTCLVGDTPIAIPGGTKPISEFRIGDEVIGGSGQVREVVGTLHTKTRKIAVVTLGSLDFSSQRVGLRSQVLYTPALARLVPGPRIRCTLDHLFLGADQRWYEAQELDRCFVFAHNLNHDEYFCKEPKQFVASVKIRDEEVDVYDIEVETDHSFLVHGVVLHNSVICIAYSNKLFDMRSKAPIGHSLPYNGGLPRHWGERSSEVAVTRSWTELGGVPLRMADNDTLDRVFRQKLRDMGWDEEKISKAMLNVQSSMDGQVSADLDFRSWIAKKPASFQDEVFGKGKADLIRRGVIRDVSDLLDFSGNPLTLRDLRQRYGIAA